MIGKQRFLLLTHLDEALHDKRIQAEVLFVDDASSIAIAKNEFLVPNLKSIQKVSVIELRRKLWKPTSDCAGLGLYRSQYPLPGSCRDGWRWGRCTHRCTSTPGEMR